jgi:integrase/recombinase XerD
VTRLRQRMLDEFQRRNYSPHAVRSYMHAVEEFARYFRRSPDQLEPDHIREYHVHLFRNCKWVSVSCAILEFRFREGWPGPARAAGAGFGHPAADHIVAPRA